jgi:hypothetical protein
MSFRAKISSFARNPGTACRPLLSIPQELGQPVRFDGSHKLLMLSHRPANARLNVLEHVLGYFKNQLSSDEKQEMLEIFDRYRNRFVPLSESRLHAYRPVLRSAGPSRKRFHN